MKKRIKRWPDIDLPHRFVLIGFTTLIMTVISTLLFGSAGIIVMIIVISVIDQVNDSCNPGNMFYEPTIQSEKQ